MRDVPRLRAVVTLLALSLVVAAGSAHAAETEAVLSGSAATINAREAHAAESAWQAAAVDPALRLREYVRAELCSVSSADFSMGGDVDCSENGNPVVPPYCDGLTPLLPLWSRTRATPTSPWSPWELVTYASCPQDVVPAFTIEDFRRLPLAPPTMQVQPDRQTVLINVPTITMTTTPPQQFTTDLLGYLVEVDATPTSYAWDYGDGTAPLVTTSPGQAYPAHDVHHTYTAPGTYTITLTATWTGRYRLTGATTWTDIPGTATTTATSTPLTAVERRTQLIAGT